MLLVISIYCLLEPLPSRYPARPFIRSLAFKVLLKMQINDLKLEYLKNKINNGCERDQSIDFRLLIQSVR